MSEALTKFVRGKAKTSAAFDKKFGGPDGILDLVDTLDGAPQEAREAAMKVLRDNADDMEAAANKLRDQIYGAATPEKKTGVRGKTSTPPETIEGSNLPNNASDKDTLPATPAKKKGGKAAGGDKAAATPPKKKGGKVASGDTAAATPAKKKGAPEPESADTGGDEDNTEIGQFVPAAELGGVEVAGSFLPGTFDPRIQMELGAAAPTFSVDTDPASLRRANPMDMSRLSDSAKVDLSSLLGDAAMEPPTSPTMQGPFRDGLFSMTSGAAMEPPADAALPGTISPDGGFLGAEQMPNPFNDGGGFASGEYGPTQFNNDGGFLAGDYGPQPRPAMDMSLLSRAIGSTGGPMDMSKMADPAFQYSPTAPAPKPQRPPLYDPNRTYGQWWNEPGLVSRANEFLYQRGMPAGIARAIQPTASVIDKGVKVGMPAAVGLGAAYGGLKGLEAISGAGADNPIAPPTDEEMAQTEEALAAAEARVRRMMQPPQNPASAMPSMPVQ